MITKVFVQKDPKTGEFINVNVYNAWFGFDKAGLWTEPFVWPDLQEGKLDLTPDTLVVGGILPVRTAVQLLGRKPPENVDYPECLQPFLRRKVQRSTLRDAHRLCVDDHIVPPVFIKPVTGHKDFDGHVLRVFRDLIQTAGWVTQHPETPVWVSEVVEFMSEFRVFVLRHTIVGMGHYRGDALLRPESSVIQEAVQTYKASGMAPAAYVIDFGVLRTGETALVEVNDGFSFGCYGLSANKHAQMLEARWFELMDSR